METASWFCTRCAGKKEMEECPLEKRVSLKDAKLNIDEVRVIPKKDWKTCSRQTLLPPAANDSSGHRL